MRGFLRAALARALPADAAAVQSLRPLVDPACANVVVCRGGRLAPRALDDLLHHRCCAVRVPGFYPDTAVPVMRDRLLRSRFRTNWVVSDPQRGLETSDVESVGTPLTVALQRRATGTTQTGETGETGAGDGGGVGGGGDLSPAEAMARYLQDAHDLTHSLRAGEPDNDGGGTSASASAVQQRQQRQQQQQQQQQQQLVMTPMDKLRLELDEAWPGGARVARDASTGRPLLAGAGRIMHPRGSHDPGFCHVDDIAVMGDGASGVFSANVYLETPPPGLGGELHVWPLRVKTRWEFYEHAAALSLLLTQEPWAQDALREVLPPPVTLVPEPGELILICAQRPHAVAGFDAGLRVSMQAFVTADGEGKALLLDS